MSQPKPPNAEEETRGFDPGQTSVSYHLGSDNIGPYLPAFGCIRLFEQAALPMRLPRVNLVGDALMNACRWVAPFISFWSPALIRSRRQRISSQGGPIPVPYQSCPR